MGEIYNISALNQKPLYFFLKNSFLLSHSPQTLIIFIEKKLFEYFANDIAELIVDLYVPTLLLKQGDQKKMFFIY